MKDIIKINFFYFNMIKILIAVVVAWLIAQIITFIKGCSQNGGCKLEYVYKSGDILSGHCASMASLLLALLLFEGFNSLFVATLVLSFIVWRDAAKRHTFNAISFGIILGFIVSYVTFLVLPL